MSEQMTKELIMEDVGKQAGENEFRKDLRASRPDNKYCRIITEQEANRIISSSSGGKKSDSYGLVMKDMRQAWEDYRRECDKYEGLLGQEKQIERYYETYKEYVRQQNSGQQLDQFGTNVVNNMNSERFEVWLGGIRDGRMASGKLKLSLRDVKDKLVKEASQIRTECGTTLVWQEEGTWYAKYARAPADSGQSTKRLKEQIALEFVEMFTTTEGLTHLNYTPGLELLKEYRDIFTSEHQQNKVLSLAINKIEKNRKYLSRKVMAEYCFESMEQDIQWEFQSTLKQIMGTKDQKYEISLPADRDLRIRKLNEDGKDFKSVRSARIARENRNNKEWKKFRGNSYSRGSFRGSRGQNSSSYRGNNNNNNNYNNYANRNRNTGSWPKNNNSNNNTSRPYSGGNNYNSGGNNNNSGPRNNFRGGSRGQYRGRGNFRGRGRGNYRGR